MWKEKSSWICPLYMNCYMICTVVQNRFSMTWWQISVIMGEIMMQRCDPCDWRKDAALMQRRGRFTPHACAASVCHRAIIGGLSLCMVCVYNPPHLEASGFHLHSPVCRRRLPACVAVSLCCNCCPPLSLLSVYCSVIWMSVTCPSQTLHPHCVTLPSFRNFVSLLAF